MTHGVVYRCAGSGGTTCRTRGSGRRPYSDTPNGKIKELGTWQHCRDNVTMFSGLKVVGYFIINIFVVATPFRHRDPKIFRIFLVPEALVRFSIFALSLIYNIVVCPALGKNPYRRHSYRPSLGSKVNISYLVPSWYIHILVFPV